MIKVCAINLSAVNALYVTMASYVVPSCLVIVVSLALVVARRRVVKSSAAAEMDYCSPDNYTRLEGDRASDYHDYDVIPDRSASHRDDAGSDGTHAQIYLSNVMTNSCIETNYTLYLKQQKRAAVIICTVAYKRRGLEYNYNWSLQRVIQ